MKTLFFVVGSENSGTRITTKLLVEAGCFGDYSHYQRLDSCFTQMSPTIVEVSGEVDNIVFRQSIPHGLTIPDLSLLRIIGYNQGYRPKFIFTMRDPLVTIQSKVASGYDEENAVTDVENAWRIIGGWMGNLSLSHFILFPTSILFKYTDVGFTLLQNFTGLDFSKVDKSQIFDADSKYDKGLLGGCNGNS